MFRSFILIVGIALLSAGCATTKTTTTVTEGGKTTTTVTESKGLAPAGVVAVPAVPYWYSPYYRYRAPYGAIPGRVPSCGQYVECPYYRRGIVIR